MPVSGLSSIRRIAAEDGSTALIANGNELDRVNWVTGAKSTIAGGLQDIRGIAIEPGGNSALVTDATGIFRVNLSSGVQTPLASTQARDIAIEPGGMSAVFPMGLCGTAVNRINLLTNQISFVAAPCLRGESIEVSPDGTFALVIAATGDTGLTRIDLRTGNTTRILDTGLAGLGSFGIVDLALKPDGSEVMASSFAPPNSAGYIASFNLLNHETRTLAYGVGSVAGLAVADNGGKVIVLGNAIYRVDVTSGITEPISTAGSGPLDIVLLPNGQDAIFATGGGSLGSIYKVNVLTGQLTPLKDNVVANGFALEAGGLSLLFTTGTGLSRLSLLTGDITPIVQGLNNTLGVSILSTGQFAVMSSTEGVKKVDLFTGATTTVSTMSATLSYIAVEPGDASALITVSGLSRIDLNNGSFTPVLNGVTFSLGKILIDPGAGTTTLLGTSEGLKRVRVR